MKNGKLSPTPSIPNITASKKPSIKVTEHMPEMGARSRPGGQYSAGGKSGGKVPTGGHYSAGDRAPTSHGEFHKLGSGGWKP